MTAVYSSTLRILLTTGLMITLALSCKKEDNPINFQYGTFPDSIINMEGINSAYDDYNTTVYEISDAISVIFSSNRKSSGGQFDIEQGKINYNFNQTTGKCELNAEITNDGFIAGLISKAATTENDFGPYRFFSTADGFEYLILSSEDANGKLNFHYLRNAPVQGTSLPEISGPFPINLFNTTSDEAYLCLDTDQDSVYYCSDRRGNFDIYLDTLNNDKPLREQFGKAFKESIIQDIFNSEGNDKCPFFHKNVIVFASDRVGGLGGYDLYYSVLKNKKWSSPVNFGPGINTSSDEFRPVLGSVQDFSNAYLIFSSNRPGGKGNFDLYLTGIDLPN